MAQVSVVVNGRLCQVGCEEGQEERLRELSVYLNQKIEVMKKSFPHDSDEELLVIASLMITDEFFDTREALAKSLSQLSQGSSEAGAGEQPTQSDV